MSREVDNDEIVEKIDAIGVERNRGWRWGKPIRRYGYG